MREAVTKVYKYDELSDEAKEKAIEKFSEINSEFDWFQKDELLELSKTEMEEIGITISEKWWESTKSKDKNGNIIGEYPCNTGLIGYKIGCFDFDRKQFLQFENIIITNEKIFFDWLKIPSKYHKCAKYYFDNRNNSSTKLSLDIESEGDNEDDDESLEDIAVIAEEIWSDKVSEVLSALKKQYEYITSREGIEETIRSNDYEFTIDGRLY
jgi:hypothetical protein